MPRGRQPARNGRPIEDLRHSPDASDSETSDYEAVATSDYGIEFGFNGDGPVSRSNIKLLRQQIARRVTRLRRRAHEDKMLKDELCVWNRIVRKHERENPNQGADL